MADLGKYEAVLKQISDRCRVKFVPASAAELARLAEIGMPKPYIDFYGKFNPARPFDKGVGLFTAAEIPSLNLDYRSTDELNAHGFVSFATTSDGDAYCFDPEINGSHGDPQIVLFTHEYAFKDYTKERVRALAKPVADDLLDFLVRFAEDGLDQEALY
jgi:hypothetical protein